MSLQTTQGAALCKNRSGTPRRWIWGSVFVLLLAAQAPANVYAQFDAAPTTVPGSGGAFDWRMPIKIGAILAAALVAGMLSYLVIYPTVLRSGGVWPVTLFGRCSALAWFVAWMAALAILWYDLVWPDEFGGTSFVREHGGRLAVFAIGFVFALVWMWFWRSDVPQKSKATQLAQ